MKKKAILILLCFTMLFMAGCKKKTEEEPEKEVPKVVKVTKEEPEQKEEPEEPEEPEEEIPANQNLLTGLPDLTEEAIGKRPVAVMVNNINDAMPQYGVGKADIIFEIPVEANLTRFMALYADYTTVPKICAVRSCRAYYPALSEGFDAIYVHWGCDPTIDAYMKSLNLTKFDGMSNTGGLYGRDQERRNSGYSLEHTGYFDGTGLKKAVKSLKMRSDLEEDKKDTAFFFNGLSEQVKPEGQDCTKVDIEFGKARGTFVYDEAKKVYLKDLNGKPQIDGKTKEQLAFTNVFVLETKITTRDDIGHKDVEWKGSHTGYYVSNGGVQKIKWSKDSEQGRLCFFDEAGNPLKINRGKSYIAINYANQTTFK